MDVWLPTRTEQGSPTVIGFRREEGEDDFNGLEDVFTTDAGPYHPPMNGGPEGVMRIVVGE
jgi:hypothetical protein